MSLDPDREMSRSLLNDVVQELAGDPPVIEGSDRPDSDQLLETALGLLVESLLAGHAPAENQSQPVPRDARLRALSKVVSQAETMPPREVGRLYEYLRGFRIEMKRGQRPVLVSSTRGKRNRGLFYTPDVVVKHIVASTLNALKISEPEQWLDVSLVDPALGTGVFLVEAMEQVSRRVLFPDGHPTDRPVERIRCLRQRLREGARVHGIMIEPDDETAVRVHLLENCLYGVDMDAIAVRIAEAELLERAFRALPVVPGIVPHIRTGNSLIGEGRGAPSLIPRDQKDLEDATAWFGPRSVPQETLREWRSRIGLFHWPREFPEVFGDGRGGFDAVIGNPPYEVVSSKESGIEERSHQQAYFRRTYESCVGKINTYRLMLERGLTLLRQGGVLGFIMPATLLADSTADRLRRTILDETEAMEAVVIPEKARVFNCVTQALLILVTRKGGRTETLPLAFWGGKGALADPEISQVNRALIEKTAFRIPLITSHEENDLLEYLLRVPLFTGDGDVPPVGNVHQGEVNLTVHREFITDDPTDYPLIRGEHITAFKVNHPCAGRARLDWILPGGFEHFYPSLRRQASTVIGEGRGGPLSWTNTSMADAATMNHEDASQRNWGDAPGDRREPAELESFGEGPRGLFLHKNGPPDAYLIKPQSDRGKPWLRPRIALGRVVNMAAPRRLKAAPVGAQSFLGDMTNFIPEPSLSTDYLLGLLNSRLLNWRIKITSTNNYLSAAEIKALPIFRPRQGALSPHDSLRCRETVEKLLTNPVESLSLSLERLNGLLGPCPAEQATALIPGMIESVVRAITRGDEGVCSDQHPGTNVLNVLDALVIKLYGVESFAAVLGE